MDKNVLIEEYADGYILNHLGKEYKYQGKSEDVINMITDKANHLLKQNLFGIAFVYEHKVTKVLISQEDYNAFDNATRLRYKVKTT